MLVTHTVARSLTDDEITPAQADAITNALRLTVEHGHLDTRAVARYGDRPNRSVGRTGPWGGGGR